MFDAVIFDFDGLILDTEAPSFHSWSETYRYFGVEPVSIATWSNNLGRHSGDPARFDPFRHIGDHAPGVDLVEVETYRRAIRDRLLDATDLRAGVRRWLDAARVHGIPSAIATSSPLEWIERHLRPRELFEHFACVVCAGDDLRGKPDPAVYLAACAQLGVAPSSAVALEDSPNGVAAAKSAGLTCFAVPCSMTASLDFTRADLVVGSLDDLDPHDYLRSRKTKGDDAADA